MPDEPIHAAVRTLLRTIESTSQLEILLLARRDRTKSFTASSISAALFLTPEAAERELALLCGRGFLAVSIKTDLLYSYGPATREIAEAVDELATLYETRRSEICALLREDDDPVRAFANAFRIRRDDDNG